MPKTSDFLLWFIAQSTIIMELPFDLVVRSADRMPGGSPASYYVNIPNDVDTTGYSTVYLASATMAGSRFNINQYNHRLTCAVLHRSMPHAQP